MGDERVSALDRVQGAEILGKLCARHETAILALHDIPFALAHTDRVVVIEDGRIALDAPARELTAADLVPYYGGGGAPAGPPAFTSGAPPPVPRPTVPFCCPPPPRPRPPSRERAPPPRPVP